MEKYFTTKIYRSDNDYPADLSRIFSKIDCQLTPDSDDVCVCDVADYWKSCILRRREYPKGVYLVITNLTNSHFVASITFVK